MKYDLIGSKFENSQNATQKAKKQIWNIMAFLLVVAGLLYYISTRALGVVGLGHEGLPVAAVPQGQGLGNDFFAEFRLSREKIQQEQMDLVKKVLDDKNVSSKVRDEAHLQYLSIVDALGKELKIEGVLKAKGWDTLAFLAGDHCTVVVKAPELTEKEVAQIGDSVKKIAKIGVQNITIIPCSD